MAFVRDSAAAHEAAQRFLESLPSRWMESPHTFEARQWLSKEATEANTVHIVIEGWVKVIRRLPDAACRGVGLLGPGSIVGLETGEYYSSSAVALTQTRALAVPPSVLWGTLEAMRPLAGQIASQLTVAQNQLAMLGISSAAQRLAAFLAATAAYCGIDNDGTVELPMRRDDIAEFLGVRPETVSRKITEFERKGWIDVPSRSGIRILRHQALREASIAMGLAEAA